MPFLPPVEWFSRYTPEQIEWMQRTYERVSRTDPATATRLKQMFDRRRNEPDFIE